MSLRWRHVVAPEDGHSVDPHYAATGIWVCYACREKVKEEWVAGPAIPVELADDPEQPGLQDDGS